MLKNLKERLRNLLPNMIPLIGKINFVVGGALEVLFCALLGSIGFEYKWLKEAGYDIEINGIKFSLKL